MRLMLSNEVQCTLTAQLVSNMESTEPVEPSTNNHVEELVQLLIPNARSAEPAKPSIKDANPDPKEIKERVFRLRGITVTQWAREHNFPLQDVYRVLNGRLKAHYGRAHEIAVALGMKPSVAA